MILLTAIVTAVISITQGLMFVKGIQGDLYICINSALYRGFCAMCINAEGLTSVRGERYNVNGRALPCCPCGAFTVKGMVNTRARVKTL